MQKHVDYAGMVADYLRTVIREAGGEDALYWYTDGKTARSGTMDDACAGKIARLKAFLVDASTAGARHRMTPYEECLLNPADVVRNWSWPGDRNRQTVRLTKADWSKTHPSSSVEPLGDACTLWVLGNDLDWSAAAGPEHDVFLVSPGGEKRLLGHMGQDGRAGDRRNLVFFFPGVTPLDLRAKQLHLEITNRPGGPYASRVLAVYLMPKDAVTEEEAARQLTDDPDLVRARAIAFTEYGVNGAFSNEGQPAVILLSMPTPE